MAWSVVRQFRQFSQKHHPRIPGKILRWIGMKRSDQASTLVCNVDSQAAARSLRISTTTLPLTGTVSRISMSSSIGHKDVQPARELTKLTTSSAPELDTEKLYPSRSTTGSESLNHDNDKRRSSLSGPSEPFPRLHDESFALGEASQLRPTPPFGHRPSETHAKRVYYEQEEDRDRVIPRDILCYLKVVCDGKTLSKRKPFERFDWQADASYEIFNNAAKECLASAPETIDKKIWRTDGVCKLFKKDEEFSSRALEIKEQWSEVLHLIIAEFVTSSGNEYAKFHLEITWTYVVVDDTVIEKRYSKKIAHLIDARIKTNWREKKFIPQEDFNAIMSQFVIENLINKDESLKDPEDSDLEGGPAFDKKQFIRDVISSHKHLLALCVHEDLPLICLWQMLYLGEYPVQLPLKESDRPPAAEKIRFDNLIMKQWFFTAYQFPNPTNAEVHCFDLRDNVVLPIEAYGEDKPIGRGASKVVYQVQIQPGHHRFTADKTSVFALKEFKNGCPFEDFERESKVLRKLLDRPHKHITPHYASWSQTGHFFMLSPLASCNLKEYWKKTQPQLGESAFVLWELTQLRGLADGVRYIYNLGGWHHDLKGENILVFEEGNRGGPTLQIADFGSAKIRARRSGPRDESSPTNNYSQGTSAYEAPDYVIRGETSRPYDVWTLGCIFMDMLVWTFGTRPSELETFSDERRQLKGGKLSTDTMFWYVEPGGKNCTTHWKPYVRKRLRELEDQCDSKKGRAVFKELVLTTKKMLRMDPSARPKAYEVHNDLERMTLWAEEALKDPKWNIQNLVIGALPSTAKSETSGELDGDGVPVIAPLGHLMIGNVAILETPRPVNKLLQRRLRDGTDLNFMGSHENLLLRANDSNSFNLVVDDVENMSDNSTHRRNNQAERPLYGSHWISPDRDAFGEARTAVASAAASELHLQGPGNL